MYFRWERCCLILLVLYAGLLITPCTSFGALPYRVKDINTAGSSNPAGITKFGSQVLFSADDGTRGFELWRSNGTAAGTDIVRDIRIGSGSGYTGYIGAYQLLGNSLLFEAANLANGSELWRSNGTPAGTSMVMDINSAGSSMPSSLNNANGVFDGFIFFTANNGADGVELWRTDGSEAGTFMVKDIRQGNSSTPQSFAKLGNLLYFAADDGLNGTELWRSDGTTAGTFIVANINELTGGSSPYNLTAANGQLFFAADSGNTGWELWKSDGTETGTKLVTEINPGIAGAGIGLMVEMNGIVYFTADDGVHGTELWRSDGSAAGTYMVADIHLSGGSAVSSLTRLGNFLYFAADDGIHGKELWRSNGTGAGTSIVTDINLSGPSNPSGLIVANGLLYFAADDGVHGTELWMSDGSEPGTAMVADLFPGTSGSDPHELTKVYGLLYFAAADATGTELWALDISTEALPPETTALPAGGSYDSLQSVTLSCNDFGGSGCEDILYTLDGSEPTLDNASLYSAPLIIFKTTTLKFFGVDVSGNIGQTNTVQFTITPVLPSIAVVIPPNNSTQNIINTISGTAVEGDPQWGLDRVEIRISEELSDGTWYWRPGNNDWVQTETWIPVTTLAGSAWAYLSSGVGWNDGWNTITARAVDNYGNSRTAASSFYRQPLIQVSTHLTLDLSSQSINAGDLLSASGRLIRLPEVGVDMSGHIIKLLITGPNGPLSTVPSGITDATGRYTISGINGLTDVGIYTVKAVHDEPGDPFLAYSESISKPVAVGAHAGYAIIVEGRIPAGEGQDSHNKAANRVYWSLKDRGFIDANIHYFNYLDTQGQPEGIVVDEPPAKARIQWAIETWAHDLMVSVPAPLYIIMVDHGNPDTFYIDTETIAPAELNTWLSTLESSLSAAALIQKRVVIVGTCYSGSFIPALSKAGSVADGGRVIITSAAANEESYRGPVEESDSIRSGEFFLEQLFFSLKRGLSFRDSFLKATDKTEAYTLNGMGVPFSRVYQDSSAQHPLLDDDGNGIGSNVLSFRVGDGLIAEKLYLGAGSTTTTASSAEFAAMTPTTFVASGAVPQTLLWGTPPDINAASSAWVEVRYLGEVLSGGSSSGQLDLNATRAGMVKNTTSGQWEVLADLSSVGMYEVYFFTERVLGPGRTEVAMPGHTRIYKRQEGSPPVPGDFNLKAPPDNGPSQKTALLLEWYPPSGDVSGLTYTVEIALNEDALFSAPVYSAEGLTTTAVIVGLEDGLDDLTTYRWRVFAIDQYGEVKESSSTWRFSTNNTNSLPGFITGVVTDANTGTALIDALLTAGSGGSTYSLTPTGDYFITVEPVTTDLSAALTGYSGYTVPEFSVSPGEVVIQNIALTSTAPSQHILTVSKSGNGSGVVTGAGTYNHGTVVTVTATPGSDTNFTGWSGSCNGSSQSTTVTMDAAKTCTAAFAKKTYLLTVNYIGNGTGSVTGTGTYDHATNASAGATPGTGSNFSGWSGDCAGSSSPVSVYMDRIKTCTATFTLKTYMLTVSKAGSGSGIVTSTSPAGGISCGSDCTEDYNYNQSVVLSASAASDSTFAGWSGDCSGTGTCQVTMTAARNVTATFAIKTYSLSLLMTGSGTGSVTGAGTYNAGSTANVMAIPDANSLFSSWAGDCAGAASTTVVMDTNKNCTVTFDIDASVTQPVKRMADGLTHEQLQAALSAVSADDEIIRVMSGKYGFGPVTTPGFRVYLKGGYDSGFGSNTSGAITRISGSLTVQAGAVIVENIGIQ